MSLNKVIINRLWSNSEILELVNYIICLNKGDDMDKWQKIVDMVKTPEKREGLLNLSNKDKIDLIFELTDSENFIDVLEYIKQAEEDANWCNSYR